MLLNKNSFKGIKTTKYTMNKWLKLLIGLILVIAVVYVWGMDFLGFGTAALIALKGGLIWFVLMIGLLLLFLGINEIKE